MDGAIYANAIHPGASDGDPGQDKHRLMSESARGEGPDLGAAQEGRNARPSDHPGAGALVLPRGEISK